MAATIGAARIEMTINSTEFVARMKRMQAEVGKFRSSLTNIQRTFRRTGRQLTNLGSKMQRNITLPTLAAAGAAIKAGIDFESAFAGVRKTIDTTESRFASLRSEILDMSKEIPTSANEIAGIAEAAGQLGIQTNNVMSFTRVMADLGVATNMTSQDAATALARLANITQMPQDEFDRLGSTVVALGNNLATTEREIVEMAQRLAGSAKQAGLAESEILGFAGALSSVGIEAQAGGTAFSKVFDQINLAVQTGSEDLNDFARVAGMTTDQFSRLFKRDAASAVVAFVEGLGKMEEQGSSAIVTLEKMGITERRMRDALLRASGAGDLFNNAIRIGNEAWIENIALTEEAAERYKTVMSRLKKVRNRIYAIGITISGDLMPGVDKAIEVVSGFTESFESMSSEARLNALKVAGLFMATGPILSALGAFSAAIGAISWPVTLGVAGFATAVGLIMKHWDSLADYFTSGQGMKMWETVKDSASSLYDSLSGLFDSLTGYLETLWSRFGNDLIRATKTIFKTVTGALETAFDSMAFALDVFSGRWYSDWDGFWSDNEDRVRRFGKNVVDIFLGIGDDLEVAFGTVVVDTSDGLSIHWRSATEEMRQQTYSVFKDMASPVHGFFDQFKAGAGVFKTQAQQMIDDVARLQQFLNMDLSMPGMDQKDQNAGGSYDFTFSVPIGKITEFEDKVRNLPDIYGNSVDAMKASATEFATVTEAAIVSSLSNWERFNATVKNISEEVTSQAIQQISSAVLSFGTIIGKTLAGVENTFATTFEKVVLVLIDFAKSLLKIAAGIGALMLFVPGMQGVGVGMLAASTALQAVVSGVEAGLQKRISNREQRSQSNVARMANGGIIPRGFPNDSYPAMLTSGERVLPPPKPLNSGSEGLNMGGKFVIDNHLSIGGREVEIALEDIKYRRER